jgi:Holliday junction resolvasome RuvABC endonuclease subunit
MILALDLGTTTGFAWGCDSGTSVSGTWKLTPTRFESSGRRFLKLKENLDALPNKPTAVVYEAVSFGVTTNATQIWGGFMATLQTWCEERNIPYQGVPVGTLKKFWTGRGNAKKPEMIAEAVARGYQPADDNEADAIALLHWKLAQ